MRELWVKQMWLMYNYIEIMTQDEIRAILYGN